MIPDLEERSCEGGCGVTFRVMPNSLLRRARRDCDLVCKKIKGTKRDDLQNKKLKFNLQPISPKASCLVGQNKDREKLWKECVSLAKQQMAAVISARHTIIKLAIQCCDIHYGGGDHWSEHSGVYTLRQFGLEIGMNEKTLQNWVRIYRLATAALPKGEYEESDYKFASGAYQRLKKGERGDPVKFRREFNKLKENNSATYRFTMMNRWARTQVNYLNRCNLDLVPGSDIAELVGRLKQMSDILTGVI